MNTDTYKLRKFLLISIGLAVLLRLLLMPFFAHVDLFSEYRRVNYMLDNALYFDNAHRIVTVYIEMFFVAISKLFIPASDTLFYLPDPSKSTASVQDYYLFIENPYIFRYLFFYKLPYFIFDLGVAAIIWRFIDDLKYRKLALLIWFFNPLTLFATYIFGRFEVFGIFFLALSAYQLKQHRAIWACVCFAVALHCREINLLLTPFLLLAMIDFKDHWLKSAIKFAVATTIVLGIYVLPETVLPHFGNINLFSDPDSTYSSDKVKMLLSLGYYWFYPIIICLCAVAIYAWEIGKREHAERFVVTAAAALCVHFAFNVHSVHYASWLVIFPILSMQYGRKVLVPFLALFGVWVCLWLLKTDGGVFTPFLAAPLSSEFIGIGHFPTYFNRNIASEGLNLHQTIQMMRSVFAVCMGFFAYRLLTRSGANK